MTDARGTGAHGDRLHGRGPFATGEADLELEIVPYDPDRADAISGLQTHLWSPDPAVNRAYFEWKYLANPYLQPPRLQLAVADGTLIGMRGLYGARWRAGQPPETFDAPCAGDLVVLPERRSGRIVQRILAAGVDELARSGLPAALNFSGGGPTQLASLMAGWRSAGCVEVAGYIRRPERLPAAGPGPDRLRTDLSVETTCRPDEMARLAERTPRDGRIRHVRDAEYFAWRYRNPLSRYSFVYARREGLVGFAVMQTHVRREPGWAHLVDWEAEDHETFGLLVRAVIRAGDFTWLDVWSSSLAPASRRVLEELGFRFLVSPATIGRAHRMGKGRKAVLVRQPRDGPGEPDVSIAGRRLENLADWELRGIYSDFY